MLEKLKKRERGRSRFWHLSPGSTGRKTIGLAAGVVFTVTLGACGREPARPAASTPEKPVPATTVAVESKTLVRETELVIVHLRIPQLAGLGDRAAEERLNRAIESEAVGFARAVEQAAHEDWTKEDVEKAKAEGWFNPYEAWLDYEVKDLNDSLVSLRIEFYEYTGGAHGMTTVKGLTVDVKTGKELSLQDLFPANADYRSPIISQVLRQLKAAPDDYFPDAPLHAGDDFDETNFYVDHGTLVVFYGLYEIAPYAAGIPEFSIPAALLPPSPYLR